VAALELRNLLSEPAMDRIARYLDREKVEGAESDAESDAR
jgi:hypothetical protein